MVKIMGGKDDMIFDLVTPASFTTLMNELSINVARIMNYLKNNLQPSTPPALIPLVITALISHIYGCEIFAWQSTRI